MNTTKRKKDGEKETIDKVEIYITDLTAEKQKEIIDMLGENGNYDIFPITTIYNANDLIWNSFSEEKQISIQDKNEYDSFHEDQKDWFVD